MYNQLLVYIEKDRRTIELAVGINTNMNICCLLLWSCLRTRTRSQSFHKWPCSRTSQLNILLFAYIFNYSNCAALCDWQTSDYLPTNTKYLYTTTQQVNTTRARESLFIITSIEETWRTGAHWLLLLLLLNNNKECHFSRVKKGWRLSDYWLLFLFKHCNAMPVYISVNFQLVVPSNIEQTIWILQWGRCFFFFLFLFFSFLFFSFFRVEAYGRNLLIKQCLTTNEWSARCSNSNEVVT